MDSRAGFSDSNEIITNNAETLPISEIVTLRRLSENLESIFEISDSDDFFADARIVLADGRELPVHRCVLSARSDFFRNVFVVGGNARLELKELARDFELGFDAIVGVLGYLYSGRVRSLPKGVCVCVDDDCSHFGCRPAVASMVEVLYAASTFEITELVALYQGHLLHILDKVAADEILLVLSVANMCGKSCEELLARCTDMIVKSDVDVVTLEKALPQHIVKKIMDQRIALGIEGPNHISSPDIHVKRIHRALDSDDVELVQLLLREGHTNLDEAYALHYSVAYCDAKTTAELLDLGLADVNCKNPRGYSVLHVAAMRKEPKIIVSLLTKGAHPSDLTLDGRKALQISKRLTKALDYYNSTEEGKMSSRERLCIEILEQAERREPLLGEASHSLAMAGDDLRMKLLYLENRVGLAKLLFPIEAKVVLDIAQIDGTCEFALSDITPNVGNGTVDLNEAPFRIKEEHLIRMKALSRTVALGKRFFPRCSEVLNKIMDADDLSQLACMCDDTPEERRAKRRRYEELQEVLSKAFNEDKEEFDRSTVSSSSSSTSIGVVRRHPMKS